jgi:hypothetical protein
VYASASLPNGFDRRQPYLRDRILVEPSDRVTQMAAQKNQVEINKKKCARTRKENWLVRQHETFVHFGLHSAVAEQLL